MVVSVTEPGRPAFQLRKGEEGLSFFHPATVQPPLTESEILGMRSTRQHSRRAGRD